MTDRMTITIRRDPTSGPPERRRYEYAPGDNAGWECIEEVWTGCTWRVRGRERLEEFSIAGGDRRLLAEQRHRVR
jgi:hypothetical protein